MCVVDLEPRCTESLSVAARRVLTFRCCVPFTAVQRDTSGRKDPTGDVFIAHTQARSIHTTSL